MSDRPKCARCGREPTDEEWAEPRPSYSDDPAKWERIGKGASLVCTDCHRSYVLWWEQP